MSFAADKKVLIITSHQDDESFFCGGLLCNIAGRSEVHVICMSRAKQERDIVARNQFLLDACKMLGARGILTNFREARHVWSSADLFFRKRCEQIDAMKSFVKKQLEEIQPEIVITHNEAGEYGHCYHKVVHRVCRAVCDSAKLYFIGRGSRLPGGARFTVEYDLEKKKRLMECYPCFDAESFSRRFFNGEVITYQPETYIACGPEEPMPLVQSGYSLYAGLTGDFLHFFDRKIRFNLGWC